jgi:hypothetical protein
MSQGFNFKYDQMRENDPTSSAKIQADVPDSYPSGSNIRNVLFVLASGDEDSSSYNYLVRTRFKKSEGSILLTFTTHVITIKGVNLHSLFRELFEHIPRVVVATDKRYNQVAEKDVPIVNEIIITEI